MKQLSKIDELVLQFGNMDGENGKHALDLKEALILFKKEIERDTRHKAAELITVNSEQYGLSETQLAAIHQDIMNLK